MILSFIAGVVTGAGAMLTLYMPWLEKVRALASETTARAIEAKLR